jgi:hypothetical protein
MICAETPTKVPPHGGALPRRPAISATRFVAKILSGYLCGTHSGVLGLRRTQSLLARTVARSHAALNVSTGAGAVAEFGRESWVSEDAYLFTRLRSALDRPEIMDLILFGSQARGGTTGFSDVDAFLVIANAAADDPAALRSLRPRVLAAQRAVLAYQPMQHHGFEVVTPKLLCAASEALALPASALQETRSLLGTRITGIVSDDPAQSGYALDELSTSLRSLRAWPGHPWRLHVATAMFELAPALYLQARGRALAKHASFDEARRGFSDAWWPYDALNQIRKVWPRSRRSILELSATATRNPWPAVAIWRRVPAALPTPVRPLFTVELLRALQKLVGMMTERTR